MMVTSTSCSFAAVGLGQAPSLLRIAAMDFETSRSPPGWSRRCLPVGRLGRFRRRRLRRRLPRRRISRDQPDPTNLGGSIATRQWHIHRRRSLGRVLNSRWARGVMGDFDDDVTPIFTSRTAASPTASIATTATVLHRCSRGDGVTEPLSSFACWWWDYNEDGRLDLFVCKLWQCMPESSVATRPADRGRGPASFVRRPTASMTSHTSRARPVLVCMANSATSITTAPRPSTSGRAGPSIAMSCPTSSSRTSTASG